MPLFLTVLLGVILAVTVVAFVCAKPEPPRPPEPGRMILDLCPNGREHFTPQPLDAGGMYKVTFSGTYSYKRAPRLNDGPTLPTVRTWRRTSQRNIRVSTSAPNPCGQWVL